MAKVVTQVSPVDLIKKHPNADKLEIAIVRGWNCVVPKGKYKAGDLVVYFQPDSLLPQAWADKFGVTKYLSFGSRYPGLGRIRTATLRGEVSMGLVVDPEDKSWPAGKDVTEFYGVQKYDPPPPKATFGDIAPDHSMFPVYTEIENLRNFPNVFKDGEEIVITEKIHGMNCRIGMVDGEWMAGSHEKRRYPPIPKRHGFKKFLEKVRILKPFTLDDAVLYMRNSLYWYPYTIEKIRNLIEFLTKQDHKQVIVYGEIYGCRAQKGFSYDVSNEQLGFRIFDIRVDYRYLPWNAIEAYCKMDGIDSVPVLYRGPFSMDVVRKYASGKTVLGCDHIREGIVVRPEKEERKDPDCGRVILKYIGDEYLALKEKQEDVETDDV